ncbi:MAG: DUF6484 domain-containing protein [Myxococcota bacterium]
MAQERSDKISAIRGESAEAFQGHRVGEIAAVDAEGRALVTFEGCHGVPAPARSVVDAPLRAGEHLEDLVGCPVLLVFEDGDPSRPIVLGLLRDRVCPEARRPEFELEAGDARDVVVDGQRLVFDANQEIVLRCGKSTLILRRDGKVLVRGSNLVSRASETNRIKGGSISLN